MENNPLLFLLGMLHVFFLYKKTPIFTILSTFCLLKSILIFISTKLKIKIKIKDENLIYFLLLTISENLFFGNFLRNKITNFIGGTLSIFALIFLKLSILNFYFNLFKFLKYPIQFSFIIFFIGVCFYLFSFVSLFTFFYYLKMNAHFLVESSDVNGNDFYFSGVPFLESNSK